MQIIVGISQALLYGCLAILLGTFILNSVPSHLRPSFKVPIKWLYWCTAIIPIAALMPVIYILMYIAPRLGAWYSLKVILTKYTVGLSWSFTFLLSSLLLFILIVSYRASKHDNKLLNVLNAIILVVIIITIGWSSHAGTISVGLGIVSDSLHLLAASIWVGIVLVIAWFSTNTENWSKFLTWFSIVAISCFGVMAISGFLLLDVLVDDYVDSWLINYGQGLFLKHLFILPLLFYAAFNGIFVKYKINNNPQFNPLRGVKIESIILLTIFVITAFFTQASPPHGAYLAGSNLSPLFKLFHDVNLNEVGGLKFSTNGIAVAFVFGSMALVGLNIVALFKKAPIWLLYVISLALVGSIYITFMLSVIEK